MIINQKVDDLRIQIINHIDEMKLATNHFNSLAEIIEERNRKKKREVSEFLEGLEEED